MNTRQLFGGAIETSIIDSFLDASQFRQIPDNQEVFVDVNTQQSLIFELLEQVEASNEEIAKFHFQQLAEDNDASEVIITSIHALNPQYMSPHLPSDTVEVYMVEGAQKISKFNEVDAFNTVDIILVVVRLKKVATDFIISVNAPTQLDSKSSEQKSVNQTNAIQIENVKQEMYSILKSLKIKNWDLFG
ncbi:MAG: Ran GTPase binding protein [Benjaminiella poitrasii]|nr:MAG: Ran GTPase binding protein [Benjaminiella poitrasii]